MRVMGARNPDALGLCVTGGSEPEAGASRRMGLVDGGCRSRRGDWVVCDEAR